MMAEAERLRPADRPADAPLRRRDPPLQPRPAGRLPAVRRARRHRAGRRHHREPVVRAQRGAAARAAGSSCSSRSPSRPRRAARARARRPRSAGSASSASPPSPRRSPRSRGLAAGDARRALNLLELAVDDARRRRRARARGATRCAAVAQRKIAALRQERRGALQPHLGAPQVAARERPRRGALLARRACSRPARTRSTWRAGWCASRSRTSGSPTRGARARARRLGGLRAPRHAGGRAGARAGRRLPRARAQEQRGLPGVGRACADDRATARPTRCRCRSATPRPR